MDDNIELPPVPPVLGAPGMNLWIDDLRRAAVLADRERRALWEAQPAMTDTIMQPNQVPLVEQLRSVHANARLTINTPNPLGSDTQHFAIGEMCHRAAARLDALEMELEAAKRDAALELADERERREAAEALLRSGYTTAELIAHFARYKD